MEIYYLKFTNLTIEGTTSIFIHHFFNQYMGLLLLKLTLFTSKYVCPNNFLTYYVVTNIPSTVKTYVAAHKFSDI